LELEEEIVQELMDHHQVFQDQHQYQQVVVEKELREDKLGRPVDLVVVEEMDTQLVHHQQEVEHLEKEILEDPEDLENHLEEEVEQDLQVE
jgi:hypothetical protein